MSEDVKKSVVLLSGGLDSTTVLAFAKSQGFTCHALSVDYGQRHQLEVEAAAVVARELGVAEHKTIQLDLTVFGGSALTDMGIPVPQSGSAVRTQEIPVTYVPARNTIFLALAMAWAEVLQARDIFLGVNAIDYSGYPDCRPEFIQAFEDMAQLATRAGVQGQGVRIHAPLIQKTKAEIIQMGVSLGVDFSLTVSCYRLDAQKRACGSCDSCRLRRQGFEVAQVPDPTKYVT